MFGLSTKKQKQIQTENAEWPMPSAPIPNSSPLPIEEKIEGQLDIYSALKEIAKGKKVTKEEWGSKEEYGFLEDEKLCINLKDGKHSWILSLADLIGEDYIVLD